MMMQRNMMLSKKDNSNDVDVNGEENASKNDL